MEDVNTLNIQLVLIGIPLITFVFSRFIIRNFRFVVITLAISIFSILIYIIAKITNISFVDLEFDIYFGILVFTSICFLIWVLPSLIKERLIRIIVLLILMCPIYLSVFSGTYGILGVMWVFDDLFPDKEIRLNEKLTYKEKNSGMAFTTPLLNVSIYKRLDNFGLLEREIIYKRYESDEASYNNIEIKFENDTLFLETFPDTNTKFSEKFKDFIIIDK